MAAWLGCAQARDLPLYYYNLAQAAKVNYERAVLTNRPDVIQAYYNYALSAHEDYVRAYEAFYGGARTTVATAPNSGQVFAALIQKPGDIALNLQYAQLAEAEGAPRKALTAYQRALRLDPKNVAAQKGLQRVTALLGPDATKGLLLRSRDEVENRRAGANARGSATILSTNTGIRYESSTSGRPDIIPRTNSAIVNASASLFDERTLGSMRDFRIRTDLSVDADFYIDNQASDYDTISLKLGPVFPLANSWQLSLAPFVEVNFLDYKYFSHKGGVSAAIENLKDHWLNTITVKFGRENFSSDFNGQDASQPEISATLAAYNLLYKNDYFFLTPALAYNNAEFDRFRYVQPGFSTQYNVPLEKNFHFGLDMAYFNRFYDDSEPTVARNRRDYNFLIGPSLTIKGFVLDSIDLVGRYSYERNWSNDSTQRYNSHTTGLNAKWDF
jgi:hypothetical protein